MSLFRGVEPFVHTAEKLSFRGAAAALGVTPTAVSKAISTLEADLGVRLLHRSSRKVSLTPEGEVYLRHCRESLDRLQAGRDLVTEAASVAEGRLRVSLSFALGPAVVAGLPRLIARYPRIQVHLTFSDLLVNLVDQGIDVGLRLGEPGDLTLVARRLRSPRFVAVASPAYLARRGTPSVVADLAAHTCVHFVRPSGQVVEWRFGPASGDPADTWSSSDPLLLEQGDLLVDAALAGLGIVQVFDLMVVDHLRRGELVEVFPGRRSPGPSLQVICGPGRQRVPRIRAFFDFAAELFGEGGG